MPAPDGKTYPADVTPEEIDLDRALCNFCNQAGDPFEPASQWDDYVRKDFANLCKAYNDWYRVRMMKKPSRL